jgi:hypothetical protein
MSRVRAGIYLVLAILMVPGKPVVAGDPVDLSIGGSFEYYGQLSPSYLTFDDGNLKSDGFVDNTNSNSRIGMWYRRATPWGRFNVNVETALGFRASNAVSQNIQASSWNWSKSSIRKAEVIWETRRFGTLYVGQGSMASDGIANRDLSGTSIVSYVGIADTAGAYFLRTQSGLLSTVAIGTAFPNFDGGRRGRVRYDTPSYRGLVVSASIGEQILSNAVSTKDSDITLRYDRDGPRFRIAAAGGYTWIDRQTFANNRTAIGSLSIEHKATGISFTTSSGKRDTAGNYRYFKLGFKSGHTRIGPFSISADYYAANNMVSGGSRSESYGLGILQKFANPRMEAYLGLRSYQFVDTSPIRYQDAYSVLIGARWKF